MLKTSRRELLNIAGAAGTLLLASQAEAQAATGLTFGDATVRRNLEAMAFTKRRGFTRSERLLLAADRWWEQIPRPIGSSRELEVGMYSFTGHIYFKLLRRVVEGKAVAVTWSAGKLKIRGHHDVSTQFQFEIMPDLSNQLVSHLYVGE